MKGQWLAACMLALMVGSAGAQDLTVDAVTRATELNPTTGCVAVLTDGRTPDTDENTPAFGWEAVELDAHDAGAVYEAVTERKGGKPMVVIGKSTKGKGVSFMEDVPIWHYRSPSPEEYAQAIKEIEAAK